MEASLLGKLSGELRNRIYELALQEGDEEMDPVDLEQGWFDCPFHRCKVMNSSRTGFVHPLAPLRVTGLPLTCKTIRRESLRLYYSLNRFYFETDYLKSKHQDRIMERLVEWVERVGIEQSREMRDVTISLASVKGTSMPLYIDWEHMRILKSIFHPHGRIKIRFWMSGNGTATFTLGSRQSMLQELENMADIWCWTWQRVRRYPEAEARRRADQYQQEVAKLFVDAPDDL